MNLLTLPESALILPQTFGIIGDFSGLDTTEWATLAADAGSSAALQDVVRGEIWLTTGATDNNEAAISTAKKIFQFMAGLAAMWETRFQFAEANVDDANVFFGVNSEAAANTLADNGAGLAADYEGAAIYKLDGETKWSFETSIGTTQTTTATQHGAGGSAVQSLRIELRPISATKMEVVPWWDPAGGNNFAQMLDVNGRPIKHTVNPTAGTAMFLRDYVKAGGANSEVLKVDYLQGHQRRVA